MPFSTTDSNTTAADDTLSGTSKVAECATRTVRTAAAQLQQAEIDVLNLESSYSVSKRTSRTVA